MSKPVYCENCVFYRPPQGYPRPDLVARCFFNRTAWIRESNRHEMKPCSVVRNGSPDCSDYEDGQPKQRKLFKEGK